MLNFPPASTPSQPSRSSRSTGLKSLWWTAASHQLSALHVVVHICQCYSLSFSPLLCPKFILYVWVSTPTCPANGFIRIIFLDSTYIQCLCEFCFSLSDLHHSEIQALGSFTSWELAHCVPFYGWVIFHCVYKLQVLYPFKLCKQTAWLVANCPPQAQTPSSCQFFPDVEGHLSCFHVLPVVNMLQWTSVYMCLFQLWFSKGICPVVRLLVIW